MTDTLAELFERLLADPKSASEADLDRIIEHYREKAVLYVNGIKEPKKTEPIDIGKLNL